MPFRDHFRPPVSKRHSWEEVHGGWPMMIVQKLAPLLPDGYQAAPRVHLGSYFEVDIGAFENDDAPRVRPQVAGEGGALTVPEAELSLETDSSDVSEYEVLIYDVQQEKRLVAAIEIISPANKDRPAHRNNVVSKCAVLLKQGVCVVLVDIVTIRNDNLYVQLLDHFELTDPGMNENDRGVYAACCRTRRTETKAVFDFWRKPLKLDVPLPTLPLWLTEEFSIPLDLEASYEDTCRLLRIA
jgi:Protein of unknown function (DUF4058)